MKTVDAYVRVSRVGGRGGESFISTDEQKRAIEAYAAAHKLTLGEWHTDLDQSGGTLERPGFQAALERCRNGEAGGLIAAKLDRLTRSTIGLGTLIEQARAEGWNLIAVDFGLDLFTANGKLVGDVLAAVAEWERSRKGDDWAAARRNAIERGVPHGRVPFGYRKRPDGRLELDEREAKIVRELFRQRAAGDSFSQLGREHGIARSTVRQMLEGDVYLGVARSGPHRNEQAHPPIISRAEFDAAQAGRTVTLTGETTRGRLLVGIASCAGCGHTLKVTHGRARVDGSRDSGYYCKNEAKQPCPERAFVQADALDAYIADWFTEALETVPRMVDVVAAGRELEQAQGEQAQAEAQLHGYVEQADALDPALFQRGLRARQERLDRAVANVRELSARVSRIPAGGALSDLWQRFDPLERRDVLAGFLDRVEVSRGASAELESHVRVVWADGTDAETALAAAA